MCAQKIASPPLSLEHRRVRLECRTCRVVSSLSTTVVARLFANGYVRPCLWCTICCATASVTLEIVLPLGTNAALYP